MTTTARQAKIALTDVIQRYSHITGFTAHHIELCEEILTESLPEEAAENFLSVLNSVSRDVSTNIAMTRNVFRELSREDECEHLGTSPQ